MYMLDTLIQTKKKAFYCILLLLYQIRNNPADRLLPGQLLSIGKYILSKNGKYSAEMQTDGTFLVYVI